MKMVGFLVGTAALLGLLGGYSVAVTGDDLHPGRCDLRQTETLQLSDMRLLFPDQIIVEPMPSTSGEFA